jgi:hypothetical protein
VFYVEITTLCSDDCLLYDYLLAFDMWRYQTYLSRSSQIVVGNSKAHVENILGKPIAAFGERPSKVTSRNEWCYGQAFINRKDWGEAFYSSPPFFFPFRLRLFACDQSDIRVIFEDNKVFEVRAVRL